MIVLRPSAKINLTLQVGVRRADGFHDVRSVMQSIALSDRLGLTRAKGPLQLAVRPAVAPADRSNLVWKAAEQLWRALGRAGEPHGVRITLDKRIPAAAGLGGGSADAAAALVGLHRLWKGRLPRPDLLSVAAGLGSDVPFFLVGGTALALGRGDDLVPLADVPRLGLVLVKPAVDVSTPDAYRWLDGDRASGVPAAQGAAQVLDIGWPTGAVSLVNDLEAPVTARLPIVSEIIHALVQAGARAAAMSGSGSAVFGVFTEAAALRAARRLARREWQVIATRTLTRREAGRRGLLC